MEEIYSLGPVARLEQSVSSCPDKPLLVCGDEVLTRAELWRLSDGLAYSLMKRGLRRGDHVGVYGGNSIWHYLTHWACLRAGLIWAPINPGLSRRELEYTLQDLRPKIVFVSRDQQAAYSAVGRVQTLPLDRTIAFLAAENSGKIEEVASWRPGDAAYIMYSGGTTGLPKAIILPYALPAVTALKYDSAIQLDESDTIYSCMTMHHTWLLCLITAALYADCTVHVAPRFSASRWYMNVRRSGATVVDPFLPMIAMILRRTPVARKEENLPPLRACNGYGSGSSIGESMRREFERRFNVTTYEMYGLTEAPFVAVSTSFANRRGATGQALPWFETRIVDDDDLEMPTGAVGEILVRPLLPHQTSIGYLNKAESTVATWRNMFIHTGDRGRMDADGYLYFVGRRSHYARCKGENVSLTEVEGVLAEHEDVADCAAVAVPSDLGDDDIKACVVATNGRVRPEALVEWLATRLATFKIPRYIEFVDSIPRSITKQEIERSKLLPGDPGRTWDRGDVMQGSKAQGVDAP